MPPNHRGRLDDRQNMAPRLPTVGKDHPHGSIPAVEARAPIAEGAREDPDLVSKGEVLQGEFALRLKGGPGSPEDRPNQAPHPPDATRATSSGSRGFAQMEFSGGTGACK